jgi:hypothetical protein
VGSWTLASGGLHSTHRPYLAYLDGLVGYLYLDINNNKLEEEEEEEETPIHGSIRESVTWECEEHGVKS